MSGVKKGDMAQIRGVPAPLNEANGRVVIVGDRTVMPSGVVGWFVDPLQRVVVSEDCNTETSFRYRGDVILITVFDDAYLHPLRDTDGEDEVTRIARLKDEEEARREKANVMAPRRQVEHAR